MEWVCNPQSPTSQSWAALALQGTCSSLAPSLARCPECDLKQLFFLNADMIFATALLALALALNNIATPSFVVGAWPAELEQTNPCWTDKGTQCGGRGKCSDQVCLCDPCWQGRRCQNYVDFHQPRFLVNNFYIIVNKNVRGAVLRAEATDDDLGMTCPLHDPGEGTTCPCATTRFKMLHGADSTLFNVDNETGDVFLADNVTLQPGRQYHFTLEAQGLKMRGIDHEVGRDLMRAVVYVRPEEVQQRLALNFPLVRRKRETHPAADKPLSMELTKVSPEDEPLEIGTPLTYKAVVHLPPESWWSRPVGVQISTDQADAKLALCQARVSGVKGALVSSLGPINTLEAQLFTHKTLSTMNVRAVFDFGVISLLDHNSSDSRPSIEISFEVIIVAPGVQGGPLQFIRATLTTDEAGAMAAIDLSNVANKQTDEALLAVATIRADESMAADRPADLVWRFSPATPSGDLAVAIKDVTGGQASFRVGGLSVESDDDAFLCLAPAKARLASERCLLMDDSAAHNDTPLANLHLPVRIHRRTDSALTISAWLLPLRRGTVRRRPFVTVEVALSTSSGARWRSQHNVSISDSPAEEVRPLPKVLVKAASASEVPAGIPIVFHAKMHLPRGLFNLTAALRTLTKGASITDVVLLRIAADVDQDLLTEHQIVRKSSGETLFQVAAPVLVRQDAKDAVVLQVSAVGMEKGVARFGLALAAYPEVAEVLFKADVTPYQPPIVTPEVSITPYEDQALFQQQGILQFGLELKVPEGSCTKAVTIELDSLFKGSGEVKTHLCKVTFAEQSGVAPKKLAPQHKLELGPLCAPRRSRKQTFNSRSFHVFNVQASFQAATLQDQEEIEGIIRIDARMQLGLSPFWSGGVSTHLVEKLSSSPRSCESPSPDVCLL
ncbi:uncharacterized protein LOC132193818 [Neocloeon triangulifer]|uniref:uncharacterized protein LOC132193818 n=1 Tax=Neocloeon triangulifer TaxID=2078957 RepID=UPI00286EE6A8|nr:uncharacterized protein LOC132193818 [Neocloeon triangulifer]